MATYILPVLLLAAVLALSLGIGYLCMEFIVRLIGRGLGVGYSQQATVRERHAKQHFRAVAR